MLRTSALSVLLGSLGLLAGGCGASSTPVTQQQKVSSYLAFAACLNKHGVQVEPASTGGLVWEAAPGVPGPGSPLALAAVHDCKKLVPMSFGHPPTAAENAANLALMLRLAKCMRARGPELPRPDLVGHKVQPLKRDQPRVASVPYSTEALPAI